MGNYKVLIMYSMYNLNVMTSDTELYLCCHLTAAMEYLDNGAN